MSTHTKSEWRVSGPNSGLQYNIQSDTQHIAIVSHLPCGDSEAEANAHLIAAAPELLEVCNAMRDLLKRHRIQYAGTGRIMPEDDQQIYLEQVVSAIAKATGKEAA